MSSRVVIHIRNVHQQEFSSIFAGKRHFVLFQPYEHAALAGDVVTVRELDDATGERTGRELTTDVLDVMLLDHMQIVGILPRKFKIVFSGRS
jgi:hypothetical protein